MNRTTLIAALSSCAIVLYVSPALACRCVEPSLDRAYKQSDAVAEIRITAVSNPLADGTIVAEGEIVGAWKAQLPSTIRIVTGEDCAYPLKANNVYVLYLSKSGDAWGTYKCRGNNVLAKAHDALRWLSHHGASTS